MKMKKNIAIIILFAFSSCASLQSAGDPDEKTRFDKELLEMDKQYKARVVAAPDPDVPDFQPIREEVSPLDNKFISITAMATPLKDVLHVIAEVANLNIVMGNGVDPDLPVSMTVKEIGVGEALDIIFDSVDYFYEVKNNILTVKAIGTKIFEIDQPNIIQSYRSDIGGDILSGTASGSGGQSAISGDVSMTAVSDETSFKFWDGMEKSLATLVPVGGGSNFVVNRMAGTIMVVGTKNELQKVEEYIVTLKKVLNRQVVVEARIVEVQLSDGLEYGIDWTAVGAWMGAGMSVTTNSFRSVVSGTSNFELSILGNDNLTFLLRALSEQGEVKTLSNPRVNIMNGQTSMLSVGRNTTFISKVETTTSEGDTPITTYTVETNSVLSGLMFGLVPYISGDGEIKLTITPIITNLVSLEDATMGTGDNATTIKLPTVDLREMSTTVKVLDGQMVIIGGLIDKKESSVVKKVPFLGDIPLIGGAFKRVDKSYENTELVIMLIPRIL